MAVYFWKRASERAARQDICAGLRFQLTHELLLHHRHTGAHGRACERQIGLGLENNLLTVSRSNSSGLTIQTATLPQGCYTDTMTKLIFISFFFRLWKTCICITSVFVCAVCSIFSAASLWVLPLVPCPMYLHGCFFFADRLWWSKMFV